MSIQKPVAMVIIGGAGDLAQRKLFPALFNLFRTKQLPEAFCIIGLARTERSETEYRSLIAEAIREHTADSDEDILLDFCSHAQYLSGSFDDLKSYDLIRNSITSFESLIGGRTNTLFYLAVPPSNYDVIFRTLHTSALAEEQAHSVWARILVEKPFGRDYSTATALEKTLYESFKEQQIFRIDHYLAKEAVMNILAFRFANPLLKSSWSNTYIREVRIKMHERINVSNRGAFYDTVGALRDVGQNHILQIVALITMDEPASFTATDIRNEREKILSRLQPLPQENPSLYALRAQYDSYRNTPGVAPDSKTETYFESILSIDHEHWKNVPFYISAGKGLSRDEASVEILFHDVGEGLFESPALATTGNKVYLTISPVQSMNISLNSKASGHGFEIETNTLSFSWEEGNEKGYTAYEKIILDCLLGDQTLFTKTGEVLASWKFIDSLLQQWENLPLHTYQEGSEHPEKTLLKGVY